MRIIMKSSHACKLLLLFINFTNLSATPQFDKFLESVRDAHSELGLFDSISLEDIHRRKSGASVKDLLGRFEFPDDASQFSDSDLTAGDAWYQSFRALECKHGGCSKRTIRWKIKKAQPEDYYDYYEEAKESPQTFDLKDQWEETPNDLSHEANYKLSKVEQDAVEKSLPDSAWPIHHSAKRSSDLTHVPDSKVSFRQIKNEKGPTHLNADLDDEKQKTSIDENLEPWKEPYEVLESRKLLSITDPEDGPIREEKNCKSGSCSSSTLDMDQFDNIKQKTYLDRELEGLAFDNTERGNNHHKDKKGIITSLSDDLMQSSAFLKLKDFLKGKAVETNKTNGSKSEPRTTTSGPLTKVPLNLAEKDKDRDVNIKLHMTVNATVLGDGKLPEQFHKNNTLTFKPPMEGTSTTKNEEKKNFVELDNLDLDRDRRGVVFPILTSDPVTTSSKRKTNAEISKSVLEATENSPLNEIITGKLTSQLVKTIFAFVKSSPSLKVLWPGLKRNQVALPKDVQNFYAIRTEDNESEIHRTELMLRQAMESINAIIEQQVRSRSCIPLRPDLKAFWEIILRTRAENDKLQDRQKRESEQAPSLSDNQIRKKSRIVKKLLRDYEELPREDQDQVAGIKDRLLVFAEELRELEQAARIQKRHIMENYEYLSDNNTNTVLIRDQQTVMTPQYMKLARTAEMLLHNSVKDPDLSMNFDYI